MAKKIPTHPAMIALRPGDRVLVTLIEDPEVELAEDMARQLHQSFPGVEFVIMGGVKEMLVQAGAAPAGPMRRVG